MRINFENARKILQAKAEKKIVAINGCCFGKDKKPDKGDYLKLCGQNFWEFISGNPDLYIEIIKTLGHNAKVKNEEFLESYAQLINKFTLTFANEFCEDGKINWNKLVRFNSSK